MAGEESTADEALSAQEQAILSAYLESGGDLFISGAEISWDLDERGGVEDQAFMRNQLGSAYERDDAGVQQVSARSTEPVEVLLQIPNLHWACDN